MSSCATRADSSGNQENCFNKLSTGESQHQGLFWLKCLCLVEIGFHSCFLPLFRASSLCYRDVFCLSMGFGLPPLEIHLPSRWKWDSASNPCSQRQRCFLAGKWGASFACKSVSISSPTPTNYVSLSFTQLPAALFQYPHLWLPINTTASQHSTTSQPPVAINGIQILFWPEWIPFVGQLQPYGGCNYNGSLSFADII